MRLLLTCLLFILTSAHAADINTLRKQAIQRDKNAQYELALRYQQGQDVKSDPKQSFYWMEQAAENGHTKALSVVADAYLNGTNGVTPDTTQAIYWLTRQATLGDTAAQFKLGQLYEKVTDLPGEEQALLWYRIASATNPQAEQRYSLLLEQQFNRRRAREISQRKALEQAQTDQPDEIQANRNSSEDVFSQIEYVLSGGILILALAFLLTGSTCLRLRKQLREMESLSTPQPSSPPEPLTFQPGTTPGQQQKIKQQEQTIRKQKQQLSVLFQELKRLQQTKAQPQPVQTQGIDLACALFGFSATEIPDIRQIKLRYKQLSKIYHPDMKGSEEEMKRLNQALKLLLSHSNQARPE
ncbi:J domain-containing protein [Vibrio mangrovi]|uniref:Localization factor PodJL n=1 Tax=Vibrio mangrovi TaxID=474394 RepID=A0A1Y6IP18_9VIBR|nr:tetratricopeptide repeat protein [Vibrio mangrovi]MDW6003808.1 hypothetical protein [Vibrio mangrovi]SMR99397.1 Localization factor PodJL [Vibrio mangrovi]